MQKYKKIILISSGVLCTLGIIIMAIAMMAVKFDVKALDLCGEPQKEVKVYSADDIASVTVTLKNSNVIIKTSTDDKIRLTYYTTDCCPVESSLKENCINLYDKNNAFDDGIKQYTKGFFHGYKKHNLNTVIEIPADCKDISITTYLSNGWADVSGFTADNVDINTSNGAVSISEISANNIDIETNNGEITADSITANKVYMTTSNGEIILSDINCADNIAANTSNGTIISSSVNSSTLSLNTSNGEISLVDIKVQYLEVFTSNGSILPENISAQNIVFDTSNGEIRGNIIGKPEDYYISSGTSNGNNSLAIYNNTNEKSENILHAYTSNGDILIKFSE